MTYILGLGAVAIVAALLIGWLASGDGVTAEQLAAYRRRRAIMAGFAPMPFANRIVAAVQLVGIIASIVLPVVFLVLYCHPKYCTAVIGEMAMCARGR